MMTGELEDTQNLEAVPMTDPESKNLGLTKEEEEDHGIRNILGVITVGPETETAPENDRIAREETEDARLLSITEEDQMEET